MNTTHPHRSSFLALALTLTLAVAALSTLAPARARAQAPAAGDKPATATAAASQIDPAGSYLGLNIAGLTDWDAEIPFVDEFHLAREWISQKEGEGWGKGPKLDLDEHGWIKSLAAGCLAETPLFTGTNKHYPKGDYTVLYEGEGELKINVDGGATVKSSEPGKTILTTTPDSNGWFVQIRKTNPQNYIRNIRVLMPGSADTYQKEPFQKDFLARLQGFNTIRFMDWMATNGSKVKTWADRPKLEDASWTTKGAPVEVMVTLCNRLKANAWFCMPHLADDDYVRHFAQYVKANLDPQLKVYIEYSNEVWNGMFEQSKWVEAQAKEMKIGPPERPWEGKAMRYVQRVGEIGDIWKAELPADRLVRVAAWQAGGGEYWLDGMLLAQPAAQGKIDALAIAPYITFLIPEKDDKGRDAATVATWSLDQLFAELESKALPESLGWMKTAAAVAQKHQVKLVAYEGGQHLVGVQGGENNDAMTKLFQQANRDPRMGALYTKYLDGWKAAGGDTFCIFSSVGPWSKWGSWGFVEYYDETEKDQPKYQAIMDWQRANRRPAAAAEAKK